MPTLDVYSNTSGLGSSMPKLDIFSNTSEEWAPALDLFSNTSMLGSRALALQHLGPDVLSYTYLVSVSNAMIAGAVDGYDAMM